MAKVQFSALTKPAPITDTREFDDSLQPGVRFSLTFKALDEPSMFLVADETAKQILARLGDPENEIKAKAPPIIVDGQIVKLSKPLIQTVTTFCVMQVSENTDEAYSFENFVQMSLVMPNAFRDVSDWANDLNRRLRGKKLTSDDEQTLSDPHSGEGSPTPTS